MATKVDYIFPTLVLANKSMTNELFELIFWLF